MSHVTCRKELEHNASSFPFSPKAITQDALRGLAWTGGQASPGGLLAVPPPHSSVLGWNLGASFYILLNFPWVGKLTPSSSYGGSYTGKVRFKVRRGDLVQGKEQWLRFAGAALKRYPTSKVRETQVRW